MNQDQQEEFDERAGKYEYLAGFSREVAEKKAMLDMNIEGEMK